jgi:mono/diheme cytochrome c family protein
MRRVALLGLLLAAPAWADAPGPTFGAPFHFTESGGEAVYAGVCAGCHMPNGRGAAGAGAYPSLAGDAHLASAAYPITLVLRGRAAMPPFGRTLTDQQVAEVVGYIRRNFGNDYVPPPSADDVKALR